MPELPEVEVLRRSLERRLPGRRIVAVETRAPALREPLDRRKLRRLLEGRRIEGLRRRAKYLLIDLEGESTLVVHLGMSGRLTVVRESEPPAPHEHFLCRLDRGERLRLVDPRRFGVAFASRRKDLERDPHFAHLGVEPLEDELSSTYLRAKAKGRRGPLKSFLMDARIVVGVGNIYASEALWRAGVHPRRAAGRVSRTTWERVARQIRAVLADAIDQGGTTLNDFMDGEGNSGYFQVSLSVYGREGESCLRCDRPIRRLVLAGRGTYYCAGCQH